MDIDLFLKSGALVSVSQNQLLVGWGKRRWSSEPGSFYFPDFFLTEEKPWFTHEFEEVVPLDFPLPESEEQVWQNPDYEIFSAQFKHLQNEMALGRLQKGVPYAFAEASFKPFLSRSLLEYARAQPVFLYGFWDEKGGMLGATPEKLFTMDKSVETMALAGTRRSGAFDAKEHKEHRLVIEGIKESLSPFGEVQIGTTCEVELPYLKHLMTPISLSGTTDFDNLTRALHPTPALGAFPKEAGWKWLSHYQTILPRGRFGAPVGYRMGNRGGAYVAIRNMQWSGDRVKIGAGCGVVKESELEKEWNELNLKIESVKRFLKV